MEKKINKSLESNKKKKKDATKGVLKVKFNFRKLQEKHDIRPCRVVIERLKLTADMFRPCYVKLTRLPMQLPSKEKCSTSNKRNNFPPGSPGSKLGINKNATIPEASVNKIPIENEITKKSVSTQTFINDVQEFVKEMKILKDFEIIPDPVVEQSGLISHETQTQMFPEMLLLQLEQIYDMCFGRECKRLTYSIPYNNNEVIDGVRLYLKDALSFVIMMHGERE